MVGLAPGCRGAYRTTGGWVQPPVARCPGDGLSLLPHGGRSRRHANIPPTETCMGCHSQIISRSEKVAFLWQSWETGNAIQWNKVHDVPDFVYFNHSIHVAKGVGCSTCHGRIDQMRVVYKTQPLFMSWCLDCHRNPEKYVRPREEIYNMAWTPPANQLEVGRRLVQEYNIRSSWELTNCAICHR